MLGILLLLFRKYYLLMLIFILVSTIGLFFVNYGSVAIRFENIISILNNIDMSFNGFRSLDYEIIPGIKDQNDIPYQFELVYELSYIGIILQIIFFIFSIKNNNLFGWIFINYLFLTYDAFFDFWILILIYFFLEKQKKHKFNNYPDQIT